MRKPAKPRRSNGSVSRRPASKKSRSKQRSLQFQSLEKRALLAGDVGIGEPLADITGLWLTVGERDYFTSEQASVTVDMYAGESIQVTGIQYDVHESMTDEHGVIAFESYVRREHGAATIGSYDYTNGRFADPIGEVVEPGQQVQHPGFETGWQLEVIDNRIAVVAVRYFDDEFVVEDRLLVDVNVKDRTDDTAWIDRTTDVRGDWTPDEEGIGGDSRVLDKSGLTVIETGQTGSDKYEVGVNAQTVEENTWANGFVVIDYENENDFVYAGLRSIADQWVIGHFDGEFNDLAALDQDIQPETVYDLRVAVDGSHVALASDGVFRVGYDFDRDLSNGKVGLANQYAYTHFTGFHFFDNSGAPAVSPQMLQAGETSVADAQAAVAEAQSQLDAAIASADEARDMVAEADATAEALTEAADAAREAADSAQSDVDQATERLANGPALLAEAKSLRKQTSLDAREAGKEYKSVKSELAKVQRVVNKETRRSAGLVRSIANLQKRADRLQVRVDAAIESFIEADDLAKKRRQEADSAAAAARNSSGLSGREQSKLQREARDAEKRADRAEKLAKRAQDRLLRYRKSLQSYESRIESKQAELDASRERISGPLSQLPGLQAATEVAKQRRDEAKAAARAARQNHIDLKKELRDLKKQLPELKSEAADKAQLAAEAETAAQTAREALAEATDELARREAAVEAAEEALQDAKNRLAEAEAELEQMSLASLAIRETPNDSEDDDHVYSLNFNHQDDGAFDTIEGSSELVAGQIHLLPGADRLAIAVLDDAMLPERSATRVYATARADDLPGLYRNGFIVFDYQSPEDFKYAGAWAGADRWAIGEFVDGEFQDIESLDEAISEGPALDMQIWIEGETLTFLVEGVQKLQHSFDSMIDDGQIGIASYNARSRFDQVAVMQLYGGTGDAGIDDVDPASASDQAINDLF